MAGDELDFRRLHFKAPEACDRRWLEWYREEFARTMFKVDVEIDLDVPLHLEGTARMLPDITVYTGASSSVRSVGTKDFADQGTIALTMALEGDLAFQVGSELVAFTPGMAMFGGGRADVAMEVRNYARFLSFRLSPRLIAPLLPNFADLNCVPIPARTQALRLLLGYARMLDGEETIETPEARHLAAVHMHDLAALALGANGDAGHVAKERGVRAGRLAAIKNDILANLSDPRLSVTAVAGRQALTPRYVHMLFEAEGVTFTEYVIGQRLARAHRLLCDPRLADRPIGAIAMSVGFGDLSYFNRSFRRRFGTTPSDVREQARRTGG